MKQTLTIPEAAKLLGISRSSGYYAAQKGTFPCPVLTVGGRYIVPARPLCDLLGMTMDELHDALDLEVTA